MPPTTTVPRPGFCAGDVFVIAALVLFTALTALIFVNSFPASGGADDLYVEITSPAGVEYYPLSDEWEIEVPAAPPGALSRKTLLIAVKDRSVQIVRSGCRDGICTAAPAAGSRGQVIVCAPAGVAVRIVGGEGRGADEPDRIAG